MSKTIVLSYIRRIGRPLFTTREIATVSGKSSSVVTQSLDHLRKHGLLLKVCRGVWAETGHPSLSPYAVIPFLSFRHRAYVSFLSALHLHGMVEQIPQVMMLASTAHTRALRTKLGVFAVHRISPKLFKGFDWYGPQESFLIACPEKALVDSLYLSACKKKQFGNFPELSFKKSFSTPKAYAFAGEIPNEKVRSFVLRRLRELIRRPCF